MGKVSIIGAYNTAFGSFVQRDKATGEVTDTKSLYALMHEAIQGAVQDAAVEPAEIDAVWVGSFAPALFTHQDHLGPLALDAYPEALRFKPTQRVEGACASSSMALLNAVYGIEAGRFQTVLVVGVEKMNLLPTPGVTHALAGASHWPTEGGQGVTFPGLFAAYAQGYQAHYRLTDEQLRRYLAAGAALMYRHGVHNPLAHFGAGGPADRLQLFSADAILSLPEERNPMIASPLRLHDCSLVSDGAAALVLTTAARARMRGTAAVEIAGVGHTTERAAIRDRTNMHELLAAKHAVAQALAEARNAITDLQAVELHDCFTINQLLCTEALGLAPDGASGPMYQEGRFGAADRCPVNLSGGLKAKGHPVGATGASMHAMLFRQMVGRPIGLARADGAPEVTATLNVGGSGATNAVTVLRRQR